MFDVNTVRYCSYGVRGKIVTITEKCFEDL